jgi:hypothetical protein
VHAVIRSTVGINLARVCAQELRLWPGYEGVISVAVLAEPGDRFSLRVTDYGVAERKLAERALRCIERKKLRYHHLS